MDAASILVASRRRAGISQAELARRTGLPRSVVCAYERRGREPAANTFLRLLRAAGFDVALRDRPPVDAARGDRILQQVLDLADVLPHTRRREPLRRPRLRA